MRMDAETWARHANPLSVWSRFSVLPLMTLAVFSRVWLGWWALIPVILVAAWALWNPRAFGPPDQTDNWASRGTFGERVYLARADRPIPAHHLAWARVLSVLAGIGVLPWAWGLWALDPWAAFAGLVLMMGAKAWLVDRMVWLFQDMAAQDPELAAWVVRRQV